MDTIDGYKTEKSPFKSVVSSSSTRNMMSDPIACGRQRFINAISILSGPEDIKTRASTAFREIQELESKNFVDQGHFERFSNLRSKISNEDLIRNGSLEEALAISGIISSLAAAVILK
ncbi:MAG: hypothetical protein EOP04_06465 [Proteobacteria bacterium]|nr:MAG: hypothetical protein EOP04_06465 [Pseudomonadota bacterium]